MASLNSLNSADMEAPPVVQKKPYAVWACEFSPDGRYLAVAGRDRVVRGAFLNLGFVTSTTDGLFWYQSGK